MMARNQVLFVDDDPYFLKGMERALRQHGSSWDVKFVDNGRAALKMMSDSPPDVVVADINMPEMSGDVLLGKINHRFPKTRQIVLSGKCDQSSVYRMLGSNHRFLSKPCDVGLLVDTINSAISSRNEAADEPAIEADGAGVVHDRQKDTVLLIESSHMQSRLVSERIRVLSGVEVVAAHTLAEAEKILAGESTRIFMCVTAMHLPDPDGMEIVDFVLARHLPCVVLTSSHDDGLRSRSRSRPILDYFLKNTLYHESQLFDLIRRTADNGSISVLVVDDSRTDLRVTAELLETMNFRVTTANSGPQAIALLEADPSIRVVITDNEMPEMKGTELTAELRHRFAEDEMIIIGMSSAADVTARFLKAGCNDFIKKPFSSEEFFCRVQQNVVFFEKFAETKRLNVRVSQEKVQSEKLLRNILPERVAAELKACGKVEPVKYDNVSVLFADFVGFTANAERLPSSRLVELLGYYYSRFDEIVSQMWLDKIKTIGDCYMCVAGLSGENGNHADEAFEAAKAMLRAVEMPPPGLFAAGEEPWRLRIGIHSGPVTAGVVGSHKFAYDIWGDTVNTAARIESAGKAGLINVSEVTQALLTKTVSVEPRGRIEVKGKGSLEMYFVS
jgi:DNA-binding NtrC family response regulator